MHSMKYTVTSLGTSDSKAWDTQAIISLLMSSISRLSLIVRVKVVLNRTVLLTVTPESRWLMHRLLKCQSLSTTTVLFRTTFPGRSNSTYFWNGSWVQTFHNLIYIKNQHRTSVPLITSRLLTDYMIICYM